MSVKSSLKPYHVSTNQSLGADFSTTPTNILNMDSVGYEIDVSSASSLNGVFSVQVSLSYDRDSLGNVLNAGSWTTIEDANGNPIQATVTANGTVVFDLNQLSAPWVRVLYTRTGGTGTANVYVSAKRLGG
jgi:hypothetical protein